MGNCSLIGFSMDLGSMMNCDVGHEKINRRKPREKIIHTYKHIVLDFNQMATAQIGRRQRRHVQLLVLPLIGGARPDLSPRNDRQLTALLLHLFAARQILYGLGEGGLGAAYGHVAAVLHVRRDGNGLAGHVAAAIEGDATADEAAAHAADAQPVFDVAFEGVLGRE